LHKAWLLHAFYKHMKIQNQARLCLAISDFEPQILLIIYSTCLGYQGKYPTAMCSTVHE